MKDNKINKVAQLLGSNIAAYRKRKGWTQAFLGEQLGIGTDSLCRIERGVMAPRYHRLQDIADLLDCTIADLFKTPQEMADSCLSKNVAKDSTPPDIPSQIAKLSKQITLLAKMLSK